MSPMVSPGRVDGRVTDDVVLDCLPLLLAQASHDLNNHLATILGKSEVALMVDDAARWRRGLEDTLDAGQKARILVADLQQLVQWQQLGGDPVPLSDVLAMVVRLASRSLRRCGARMAVDGGSTIPVQRPASLVVLAWLLLREAAERAEPGVQRAWRLGGQIREDGWSLDVWGDLGPFATDCAALERARVRGEQAPGTLGLIDRALGTLGGRLEQDGEMTRFVF